MTVVTGGTDAGIFRIFGEGLRDRATAPSIGVVPSGLVASAETASEPKSGTGLDSSPITPTSS